MSRIGMIREVITHLGGNPDFKYYADGPQSSFGPSNGRGGKRDRRVSYKIEKFSDGLTDMQRSLILPVLEQIPGVERAYLTRSNNVVGWNRAMGGHIKVIFADLAKNMNESGKNLPVDFFTQKSDNVPTVTTEAPKMTIDPTPNDLRVKHFVQMFLDDEATMALAKMFAEGMAEAAALMSEDDPSVELPDVAALKAMTVDYAEDMVGDFKTSLMSAVDELFSKANIKIEATRTVKVDMSFN